MTPRGSLLDEARSADAEGDYPRAGDLFWIAFRDGVLIGPEDTLQAAFVFFEMMDPGVFMSLDLTPDEVDQASERFHRLVDYLAAHHRLRDDAAVLSDWAQKLGMAPQAAEISGAALLEMVDRGSTEAAWRCFADGHRSDAVIAEVRRLQAALAGQTTARARYIHHMLGEPPGPRADGSPTS